MLLLSSACQITSKIRPVAVDLAINLLIRVAVPNPPTQHGLDDKNLAILEQSKEESIMVARTFFKVGRRINIVGYFTINILCYYSQKTCSSSCLRRKSMRLSSGRYRFVADLKYVCLL